MGSYSKMATTTNNTFTYGASSRSLVTNNATTIHRPCHPSPSRPTVQPHQTRLLRRPEIENIPLMFMVRGVDVADGYFEWNENFRLWMTLAIKVQRKIN